MAAALRFLVVMLTVTGLIIALGAIIGRSRRR
jgi:hypothetical protein